MNKIKILPGEPNDDNRDYLPQAIKGSRMVVNENGNNSQVYPERLSENTGVLTDDLIDTWYEYVPESYDPSEKAPLVLSMHGGLMSGWGQAIYTSWTLLADREGFICAFLNASQNAMWTIECDMDSIEEITQSKNGAPALNFPEGSVEDFHDVKATMALVELMKEKYNIDESRIYIQGMSMGNCMEDQVARYHGDVFAASAGSGCPTNCKLLFKDDGSIINKGGPLDVWHSRLQFDKTPYHYNMDDREVILGNIDYWKKLNGCRDIPQIKIAGEKNFIFYKGDKANVTMMDVHNRDHGQTFDDAEMVWDYMFSGVNREGGQIVHTPPLIENKGDSFAIAIAEGCSKAWVKNKIVDIGAEVFTWNKLKYHGLNGDAIIRGQYLSAPIEFIADTFGAQYSESDGGLSAEITLEDGRRMQFARGCIGCVAENRVESMLCEAVMNGDKLCISLEWFCSFVYNMHVSEFDGVLYATDHYSKVSRYTAWVLQDLLRE
ncbi:MAG: PHB depolymerase family esterase [Eubacteriales bacterium]